MEKNKGRQRLRWIDNNLLTGTYHHDRGQWRTFIRAHRRQMAGVRN